VTHESKNSEEHIYIYKKNYTSQKYYYYFFFFYFVGPVHRKCCGAVFKPCTGGSLHINYLLNAAVFQVAQKLLSLAGFHSSVSVKCLVLT